MTNNRANYLLQIKNREPTDRQSGMQVRNLWAWGKKRWRQTFRVQAEKQTRMHAGRAMRVYDHKCTAGKDTKMCAGRHEDFNAYKVQADNRYR